MIMSAWPLCHFIPLLLYILLKLWEDHEDKTCGCLHMICIRSSQLKSTMDWGGALKASPLAEELLAVDDCQKSLFARR